MRKINRFYILAFSLTVLWLITALKNSNASAHTPDNPFKISPAQNLQSDTIPVTDTTIIDSLNNVRTDTFKLKLSKDTLEAPVKYSAEDSAVGLIDEKLITLYGKAKTDYQDMSLSAPVIELNQGRSIVTAKASRDSVGGIKDYAVMKQGQDEFKSEGMSYNFKTKQGLTRGTITQQGEMFVHADIVKKADERTMYAKGAFFTTCNLDEPHFGFRARRAKIVNKKLAVTGPVRPEFDSVPVPIYLPFGFYPLYQGRHSGFIAPSFEENDRQGLGLNGMGYYYAVNDHWDVRVTGELYSSGTWAVNISPMYRKIYKYSGSLGFTFRQTRLNAKMDPDFFKQNNYQLMWSHSSDTRSRPGTTFSASVNASSSGYNRSVLNNAQQNFNNTMGSSINYSKTWQDKPFSLTVSANHNQSNVAKLITVNLPDIGFTMNTLYPFENKEGAGTRKWYEQFGVGYQGSFRNGVSFYDDGRYRAQGRSFGKAVWDTMQWGAQHSFPISLQLPPIAGGALIISPSVSYSQEWLGKVTEWRHAISDSTGRDTVVGRVANKFVIKQQASFGLGINTALYGTYQFKKSRVVAIRHVMRPTFGASFTPDLNGLKYWQSVVVDSVGTTRWFNKLDGMYGSGQVSLPSISNRQFGGLNFGLDNNLEMKVRTKQKKDTASNDNEQSEKDAQAGFKKIKLIDGFGINSSYNFMADSFQLAPFNMYFRTNLFEKININASATLTPYVLNKFGNATPVYAFTRGKLGTITNGSVSASTSFQSKPKDPEKEKKRKEQVNQALTDPMLQADQQRLLEYMRQNPAEFVDFNTPWSVSLSYSLNFSRGFNGNGNSSGLNIYSSANFSGSFNLTPKWNFSVNGSYDVKYSKIQYFSMAISRDLHCWQMSINVSPVGMYRYFNFTISPKAGILQDLKINRNRSFSSY